MILVDASVWIDHLHRTDARLATLLDADRVATHDGVIQELALGSMRHRDVVITSLEALIRAPDLKHDELIEFAGAARLWGKGLSAIDVRLLGGVRIARFVLWTRDRRLRAEAARLGIRLVEEN